MEGRARQAACLVAGVVLACALVACRHSGGSAAPLALSTSVLASSNLDWLGGGTYGDPYPANGRLSPQAHLAPAALAAEAGWKKTMGNLFSDARTGKADPLAQESSEPRGQLLVAAKEGEKLWQEQIKAMQAGELQANREVMNTVSLLRGGHGGAELQAATRVPPAVQLSASADTKAAAHARLSSLAAKRAKSAAAVEGKSQPPTAQASKASGEQPGAKQARAEPDARKVARREAATSKGGVRKSSTQKLAAQPSLSQVLKTVTVKPTDLTALDVATSDSSRNEMSSFFDSLAARDEAKHVLHESRYPRTHSVRAMLPTSVMPAVPPKTQMTHLEKEVTWLRKRVEVLQDALLKEDANSGKASQKTAPTKKLASPVGGGEAKKSEKRAPAIPGAKEVPDAKPASTTYVELTHPPPRGCPLFAAPGERLPADCPRISLARLDLHRCADGAIRLACRDETIPREDSALAFEGGDSGTGDDSYVDDSYDEAESH